MDNIKGNPKIKFTITNNIFVVFMKENTYAMSLVNSMRDGDQFFEDKFSHGIDKFRELFSGKDFILKNIAVNLFVDLFINLNMPEHTFFEFYSYFASCITAIQVLAYSIALNSENAEYDFIKTVSVLSRNLVHSVDRANMIIDYIQKKGLVSPAHLALIIK